MPPKPGLHTMPDAFIHAMPAYIPALKSAGMKWVSGYPENYKHGLPYITGLLILNDTETGLPLAVMDCVWITAMRTGAATAVAAKYLARRDSRVAAILGCGVQGRTNIEALSLVLPDLRKVRAYDIIPENLERYVREMSAKLPLEFFPVSSPAKAVLGADVIVTAGPILKRPKPAIEAAWFKEGAFASPVDFDSYWQPAAMALADKFCTDDTKQLEYYRSVGYFQNIPPVYGDLGEIVAGKKRGRERENERTISANLGLALEDMATAIRIYKMAREKGIGRMLPL
jgi:ornithine cyclodeaminase/alanine dehydrogenase